MKTIYSILLLFILIFSSNTGYAQDGLVLTQGAGSFFIAILAGVLLAFAFQFLLANLTVALGITAIGDLRKKGNKNREYGHSSSEDHDSDSTPTGVKISTGAGVFMLVTLSLSLFFASLIAVKLSLLSSNTIGFSLGLVIWAATLILGIYLDSKIISGIAGSIFGAVKETISSGASAVGGIFSKGQKSQAEDTARATVKAIHKEIRQEFKLGKIDDKLNEYISKLEPQRFDMENIHEHLAELLNEIEIKEQYTPDDPEATKRLFLDIASKQKGMSAKDKEKLKGAYEKAREILNKDGSRMDKAKAVFDKFTPGDEEQGKEYRQKVEQYLRRTGKEELSPESLKQDLNRILENPKAAPEVVQARVSQLDRSTLKAVLTTDGISEQKVERYLATAEQVVNSIKRKVRTTKNTAGEFQEQGMEEMYDRRAGAERAIENWFNRMDQPELQYEQLKNDFDLIMDDPKAAPHILRNRLRRMDRQSLVALMSNNKRISREQAEKVVDKIEEARDRVIHKTEEIERQVKTRLHDLKQETLRQAEATRKTAAAAAWWFFMAAIVSGIASALGGILAFTT
jgi:hypothetical protein